MASFGESSGGFDAHTCPAFRLTYVSRAREQLDAGDLEKIAASAQRFNKSVDVSGLLICCAGEFLQILEGDREQVMTVFKRVDRDQRHSDVTVIAIELDVPRAFEDWSMGCFSFEPEDLPDGFFFDRTSDAMHLRIDALERAEDMLRTFYEENHDAGLARSFQTENVVSGALATA